jgi:hypothetical protein
MSEIQTALHQLAAQQLENYKLLQKNGYEKRQHLEETLDDTIQKTIQAHQAQGKNSLHTALAGASCLILSCIVPQQFSELMKAVNQVGITTFKEMHSYNIQGNIVGLSHNSELKRQSINELMKDNDTSLQSYLRLLDTASSITQSEQIF